MKDNLSLHRKNYQQKIPFGSIGKIVNERYPLDQQGKLSMALCLEGKIPYRSIGKIINRRYPLAQQEKLSMKDTVLLNRKTIGIKRYPLANWEKLSNTSKQLQKNCIVPESQKQEEKEKVYGTTKGCCKKKQNQRRLRRRRYIGQIIAEEQGYLFLDIKKSVKSIRTCREQF